MKCPERDSYPSKPLTIVNKTESVLYPSAENWTCNEWSEWGNPSVVNGWAIGPGQEKKLRMEASIWANSYSPKRREFTINFRFGTNITFIGEVGQFVRMKRDDGGYWVDCPEGYSRLLPGRFGPNTMRATWDCSNTLTLEQVPPEQPPA